MHVAEMTLGTSHYMYVCMRVNSNSIYKRYRTLSQIKKVFPQQPLANSQIFEIVAQFLEKRYTL